MKLRRLKNLIIYFYRGILLLKNWPGYLTDLFMVMTGRKMKLNQFILRDGTKFKIHNNSKGMVLVFNEV